MLTGRCFVLYNIYAMTTSIGQQLRQVREARSLSLERAAQSTRIRFRYLEAMEADDFSVFPSPTQGRGFLRTYAQYLNMDVDPLLAALDGKTSLPEQPPNRVSTRPAVGEEAPANQAASAVQTSPVIRASYAEPGSAIFVEIGQKLQTQRELLGLSLADVEQHTHLRIHYLQALEAGSLDSLPSPVQGRGMLSNYANFLGLDADALLLRFAEGLQARLASKQDSRPRPRTVSARQLTARPSALKRLLSIDLVIGGILTVFLLAFIVWGAIRIIDMRSAQKPTLTAPPIAEVLAAQTKTSPSPTLQSSEPPTSTVSPVEGNASVVQPTVEITLPAFGNAAIQVYIVVHERAYMRVMVDGKVVYEGRVLPGSAYPFSGNERVEILTGNAAALQIFHNQTDLGSIGAFGEVADIIFTLQGVQTPTATAAPTGTPTPQATPITTGTPGITPQVTVTPIP